jgi:hypothetical protein
MICFFVGDTKTQLPRMKALDFGEAILLNPAKTTAAQDRRDEIKNKTDMANHG